MGAVEHIKFPSQPPAGATTGSAGMSTQVSGAATTVSAVADATGGVGPGNLIMTDN